MRSYLKHVTHLLTVAILAGMPFATNAPAGEDPNMVSAKPSKRGTSSSQCQYLLEANVVGGKVNWIRMIIIEDRPEYANYNSAHVPDSDADIKVVPLQRQPSVGVEGVREIIGLIIPEATLRGAEDGLNLVIDGSDDTLKIRLSRNYVNGFIKQVDNRIKKG